MQQQLQAFYLVVEMVSTAIPPGQRPVIGPMPEAECLAVRLAIEAAAVPSVASVECRQPRLFMSCQFPGRPGTNYPCPVLDWDGPFAGSPPPGGQPRAR